MLMMWGSAMAPFLASSRMSGCGGRVDLGADIDALKVAHEACAYRHERRVLRPELVSAIGVVRVCGGHVELRFDTRHGLRRSGGYRCCSRFLHLVEALNNPLRLHDGRAPAFTLGLWFTTALCCPIVIDGEEFTRLGTSCI